MRSLVPTLKKSTWGASMSATTEADGARPEERIRLPINAVVGHLVGPQVERPDDDAPVAEERHGPRVRLLVVLLRGVEAVAQIEKLRAVEADAFRPVVQRRRDFLRRLDVREDLDSGAVRRDGGQVVEFL